MVRRQRMKAAALGLSVVMAAAGCGSRESDEALDASESEPSEAPAAEAAPAESTVPAPEAPVAADTTAPAPEATAAPVPTPAAAAPKAANPAAGKPAVPAAANSPKPAASSSEVAAPSGGSGSGAAPGPAKTEPAVGGAAPRPGPGPEPAPDSGGKPIVIGSIGTMTGPAGAPIKTFAEGVQIWVKHINALGGVKGHPIKVVVADDGGDPARTQALYQDLVENKGVVAFVANGDCFGGQTAVDYVNKKRVPVVGGIACGDWFYDSPMYFPYAPEGVMNWSSMMGPIADLALPQNKKKFGSMTCAEAVTCGSADKIWHDGGRVKEVGLEPVYRARISIAQPDYTAECLAAQRAGVQVLAIASDSASVHRIAAACARQSFRPMFAWPYSAHLASDKDDGNLDGGITVPGWFPSIKGNTPATAEFQSAFKKYFGGAPAGGHSGGWAASKMFEHAALASPDPTTSAGLLEGLWTGFQGETLGGLTMPLTFVREKPPVKVNCSSVVLIQKGKYVMPTNGEVKCE